MCCETSDRWRGALALLALLGAPAAAAELPAINAVRAASGIERLDSPADVEGVSVGWRWSPSPEGGSLMLELENSGDAPLTVDWRYATFTGRDGRAVGLARGVLEGQDLLTADLVNVVPPGGVLFDGVGRRDEAPLLPISSETHHVTISLPIAAGEAAPTWYTATWRASVDPTVLALAEQANRQRPVHKSRRQLAISGLVAALGTTTFGILAVNEVGRLTQGAWVLGGVTMAVTWGFGIGGSIGALRARSIYNKNIAEIEASRGNLAGEGPL